MKRKINKSITLPVELWEQIDAMVDSQGLRSRSEYLVELLQGGESDYRNVRIQELETELNQKTIEYNLIYRLFSERGVGVATPLPEPVQEVITPVEPVEPVIVEKLPDDILTNALLMDGF